MPPTRSNNQTKNALAVAQGARLQRYGARSSNLTKLMEREHKPGKREQRIARETYVRVGTIQAETLLAEWASEQIDDFTLTTAFHYARTVNGMNQILYQDMDEVTARDVAAFLTGLKGNYARQKYELHETIVGNITRIAGEPLPMEEKRKGFLDRLLDWGEE